MVATPIDHSLPSLRGVDAAGDRRAPAWSVQGVVRPAIIVPVQPGIMPGVRPPVVAWSRIESTIAWHQPLGYVAARAAAVHVRQVASILVGSDRTRRYLEIVYEALAVGNTLEENS